MSTMSVNGKVIPTDSELAITDQYQGHFLKVSYSQEILGKSVFSQDRVDIAANGDFRFFLPKVDLIVNDLVAIEMYAPNGSLIDKQNYSYGSQNAANINIAADDKTKKFTLKLNPQVVTFGELSPAEQANKKISGRVIDLSGEDKNAGLQVVILASEESGSADDTEFDLADYLPLMTATTDKGGYFYGSLQNRSVGRAFGLIAGLENEAIFIPLENDKLPANIILVADLSVLDESAGCGCEQTLPPLPDNKDLVNSSAFSQDLGGTCVDFSTPNRTLEEFSYYHTVRTTEPEIRGFTINSSDSTRIKGQLLEFSEQGFSVLSRLKSSFSSLTMLPFSIDEEGADKAVIASGEIKGHSEASSAFKKVSDNEDTADRTADNNGYAVSAERQALERESMLLANNLTGVTQNTSYQAPNYVLKLDIGLREQFTLASNDIIHTDRAFDYKDIIQLILVQKRRQQKLRELHQKLAAAYCGKHGVQEEKSFCEQFSHQEGLNKDELLSVLGHVSKAASHIELDANALKQFRSVMFDVEKLIGLDAIAADDVKAAASGLEKLIAAVDKLSPEGQAQEVLLGYLRRLAIALANHINAPSIAFEPCPIKPVKQTIGIMCLMQMYQDIRETLNNTQIFSLGEIIEIENYYQVFVDSISSFVALLEEFYTFYQTSVKFGIELVDNYFYQNYDEIRSTLTQLKRQVMASQRYVEMLKKAYIQNHPGRVELSVETSIDWDETPTVYENTTIAHGHILHFKQQWKADGYSLGDLLYSLPLAPCQEKRISILDWDRAEEARRDESQVVTEALQASISRDRDITEIMNSSLNENMSARSTNKTSSTSAGIGGGIGGFIKPVVFGIAGGVAHSGASSTTTASQNSSRNLAANSMNRLQDNKIGRASCRERVCMFV